MVVVEEEEDMCLGRAICEGRSEEREGEREEGGEGGVYW